MDYAPKCCVPSCSNTWELTKNKVHYHQFPIKEKMKQKWLDAINWPDGKPGCNHYVCSDHFEIKNLSIGIDENTTVVPTIFNPEFVAIKTENNSTYTYNSNTLTLNSGPFPDAERVKEEKIDVDFELGQYHINTENIKQEIDDDDIELDCYQIIDTPDESDNESTIPTLKKIKMENEMFSISDEDIQYVNDDISKQSIDDVSMDVPLTKLINKDISKVVLKLDSALSDACTKPANTSDDKSKSVTCISEAESELQACQHGQQWKDDETREFLKYMIKQNDVFKNAGILKTYQFWVKTEACLKELGIISQTTTAELVARKWRSLVKPYERCSSDPVDPITFPFMQEIKQILHNSVSTKLFKPEDTVAHDNVNSTESSIISEDETDSRTLPLCSRKDRKRHCWSEYETHAFLKCMVKHKNEFLNLRNRKKYKFWNKIEACLKKEGILKRPTTAGQINAKWRGLVNTYQQLKSYEIEQNEFPFIAEMREILIDSPKSNSHNARIGLDSSCQTLNKPSVTCFGSVCQVYNCTSNNHAAWKKTANIVAMQNDIKSCNTDDSIECDNTRDKSTYSSQNTTESSSTESTLKNLYSETVRMISTKDLKKMYLLKKIEGRELKNKLLMRLLNDSNCNIITNGFRVVKVKHVKKLNVNKSDVNNC